MLARFVTSSALKFATLAEEVLVQRRTFSGQVKEWPAKIRFRRDTAEVRQGTDLAVGDVVVKQASYRAVPRFIVGSIEWPPDGEIGVVVWAKLPHDGRMTDPMVVDVSLDLHGGQLLDWVFANRGGTPVPIDTAEFAGDDPYLFRSLGVLAEHVASHGLLTLTTRPAGPPIVAITAAGAAVAATRATVRNDPALRESELRRSLLLWLEDEETAGRRPASWYSFLTSPRSHLNGQLYAEHEIDREINYLTGAHLVTGPTYPRLTADGRDCVTHFGGNVIDHSNDKKNTGRVTINASDQAVVMNMSPGATQNVNHGVDLDKVASFASLIQQLLPVLNLNEPQQQELKAAATELTQTAEPRLLKRIWHRIAALINSGAQSEAGKMLLHQGVELLGQYGEDAIKQLT